MVESVELTCPTFNCTLLNALGIFHLDVYPFILLNLAFSLQDRKSVV